MGKPGKPPLFDFYDVVQVVDVDGGIEEIDRKFGIILGMAQQEDGSWSYAVDVYADLECNERIDGWSVAEENLTATGRHVSEDHVYGGETVKVSPDGDLV